MTFTCVVCHTSFEAARPARTCGPRCRKRHERGAGQPISDEDRAAIARVEAMDCWLPPELAGRAPLTPEQVRAHVLATAERS